MGNILQVDKRERILEDPVPAALSRVDPCSTLSQQLVSYLYSCISKPPSIGDDQKSIDEIIKRAFEDRPEQCNHMSQQNWNGNLVKELTELYTAGLSNSLFLKKDLQETRFEKYFRVKELGQEHAQDYYESQFRKFCILYSYIQPFMKEDKKEKEEFYDALASALECSANQSGASINSAEINLGLIFTLLNSQKDSNPQLLEESIRSMYSSMVGSKGGELEPQNFEFYEREKILTKQRNYLVSLIQDEKTSQRVKDLALKLIIVIGNMRASGEDYLVAYNLIKQYNLTVNIDTELSSNTYLKNLGANEGSKREFRIDYKGTIKIELWLITQDQPAIANQTSITFDSEYIYIYNQKAGLFKYGLVNTPVVNAGKNYGTYGSSTSDKESTILALKDELYVRDSTKTGAPFTVLDKRTLSPVQNEDVDQKLAKCAREKFSAWNDQKLEVTDTSALNDAIDNGEEDSYRQLTSTPLLTDGEYIYVVSFYCTNPHAEEKEYEPEVEVYSLDTWQFVKSKRLVFELEDSKNATDEQIKEITQDMHVLKEHLHPGKINQHTFATNGSQLAVSISGTMFFFDLETGHRLLQKVEVPKETHGYDHNTNTFWYYTADGDEISINSYKVQGFSAKNDSSGMANLSETQVKRIRQILEDKKKSATVKGSSFKSFVKSLVDSDEANVDSEESKHSKSNANSLYLIMYSLSRGCDDINKIINEFDSYSPHTQAEERLDCQIGLFRSKFAVTITTKFVNELMGVLSSFREFLDQDMTDENVLEQYQFLSAVKLVHKLILSLKKINLLLSDVAGRSENSTALIELVSQICSRFIDEDKTSVKITATSCKEEVESIWKEFANECKHINQLFLSIACESDDDLLKEVENLLTALKSNQVTRTNVRTIKYLSDADTLQKILESASSETMEQLVCIFDCLSQSKAKKIGDHILRMKITSHDASLEYDDFDNASDEFIYTFVHRVLIVVYSVEGEIIKAKESDQKHRMKELKNLLDEKKELYSQVFRVLSDSAQHIFSSSAEALSAAIRDAEAYNLTDDKEKSKAAKDISQFHNSLYVIAKDHNKFLDFVHIYIACIASERQTRCITSQLNNTCRKAIELLSVFTKYCEVKSEKINLRDEDNLLKNNLSNDFIKFLAWSLSKISHSLIKISKDQTDENQDQTHQNLLKSKLLSGGIDNRFLSCFSPESLKAIQNLSQITEDKTLLPYLTEVKREDEDELYDAIIHEGKNKSVDKLLNLFQWGLCRKPGMAGMKAKVGGQEGMTLARCAFAAIICLNQSDENINYTDICIMIDQIDMTLESSETHNENELNKSIWSELEDLSGFKACYERWEIASQMRSWLAGKVKDIASTLTEKAKEKYTREVERKKALGKKNESNDEEEKIDTTHSEEPELQGFDESEIREQEKAAKQSLIDKVMKKAELLTKLSIPSSWDVSDTSSKTIMSNIDDAGLENPIKRGGESLKEQLKRFKIINESKGNVTSYGKLSTIEIFKSCSTSVLACLQCDLTAENIMKGIEQKYIQGIDRHCGFIIMSGVLASHMNDDTTIMCLNWFCSALRKNTNTLAHYTDDIVGMGEYLQGKCRESFFQVYSHIAAKLKETTDVDTIKFLLNCLQWKIRASDHKCIVRSQIVEILRDGNGDKRREKNPIKYCWGHKIKFSKTEDSNTLAHAVIDSLEFILTACFSRLLGQNQDVGMSMKGSGGVKNLAMALSHIDSTITDELMTSCFGIIFDQFRRYIELLNNFDPIDWHLFIYKKKKLEDNNEKIEEDENQLLYDEIPDDQRNQEEAKQEPMKEDDPITAEVVEEFIDKKATKEFKKIHTMYDEKAVLKLLRLIEVFSAIGIDDEHIKALALNQTMQQTVATLFNLIVHSQMDHALVCIKIIKNLIQVGVDGAILDKASTEVMSTKAGKSLSKFELKVHFEDCPFLQFCYNFIYKIRSCQWSSSKFDSYGSYDISCEMMRLLKSILRSSKHLIWKQNIESIMDEFLANVDTYAIEEFDIITSLFEGGEYNGLNTGSYGVQNDGKKLIAVGFTENWFGDEKKNDDEEEKNELPTLTRVHKTEKQKLLAIHYDEMHLDRSNMFLTNPEDVSCITSLSNNGHDYLLKNDRFTNFLKAMQVDVPPKKNDVNSLLKSCTGIKILIENLEQHGAKFADLFDSSLQRYILSFSLKESTKTDDIKSSVKNEWNEQRLYGLKKYAAEHQDTLKKGNEKTILFSGQLLTLSFNIANAKESYKQCFKVTAAMNFKNVTQDCDFSILESKDIASSSYQSNQIAILTSEEINSGEKCKEVFDHMDVVVTTGINLRDLQKELIKFGDRNLVYCKSIILLSQSSFDQLQKIIREGVQTKLATSDQLTNHQAFCRELVEICGADQKDLDEIFKDKEDLKIGEKMKLYSQFREKKKKEKEENKGEQKEDEKKDDTKEEHKNDQQEEEKDESKQPDTDESKVAEKEQNDKEQDDKKDEKVEEQKAFKLQYHDLFGLKDHNNLSNNIGSILNKAKVEGPTSKSKTKLGDLYKNVCSNFKERLDLDFCETLAVTYRNLCINAAFAMLQHLPLQNVLDVLIGTKENSELFSKYLLMLSKQCSGSSTESTSQFDSLVRKVLEAATEDSKYDDLIEIILDQTLIKGAVDTIKKALEDKQYVLSEFVEKEKSNTKILDLHILPKVIKVIIETRPEVIYANKDNLMALVSVLLLAAITFHDESEVRKSCLVGIYKLLYPIANNPDNYSVESRSNLLNCDFLEKVLSQSKDRLTEEFPKKVGPTKKILIEIYLLVHKIEEATDCSSIFSYPSGLLSLEVRKTVLTELKDFNTIAYMKFFSGLSEAEKSKPVYQETAHNMYKGSYCAKLTFKGAKKMKVQVHKDTKLDKNSSILFTADPEGADVIKSINQSSIDNEDTKVECSSNKVYAHYPIRPSKILAWGQKDGYKLGNDSKEGETTEPCNLPGLSKNFKCFHSRANFSIGLTKDGKIYWCGDRKDCSQNKTLQEYSGDLPNEKIKDLKSSKCNIGVLTENDKIYIQGNCDNFHIAQGNYKKEFYYKQRPNEGTEKVLNWDVGYNYHVYTTDNGKAYAQGNDLLDVMGLSNQDFTYVELPFQDLGVTPIKPFCTSDHCNPKPCLMLVNNQGKNELWSVGLSEYGLLGQGQEMDFSPMFAKLDYDSDNINFVDASMKYCSAMAITDDGRLFGWGTNKHHQLGLPAPIDYKSPVEIPFFKDYYVHEFSLGDEGSIVCASPKDNMDEKYIFLLGDLAGLSDKSEKTGEGILHYKPLDNCNYSWIECGEGSYFVGFDGETDTSESARVHEGYTCEVTEQSPIKGTMHFWQSEDGDWHFVSKDGYSRLKKEGKVLPDVCFAAKYPIKDIASKEWPKINAEEVLQPESVNDHAHYLAFNAQGDSKISPLPHSNDADIFEKENHDLDPLVFYRLSRPLKEGTDLPYINLSDLYEESPDYGIKIEITPDYSLVISDVMINQHKAKYDNVADSIKNFNQDYDNYLMDVLNAHITKNKIKFTRLPEEMEVSKLDIKNKELKSVKTSLIQARINAFVDYNFRFMSTFPYVITDDDVIKMMDEDNTNNDALHNIINNGKNMVFKAIKDDYIEEIISDLKRVRERVSVQADRKAINDLKAEGRVDDKGEWTIFAQVMKQCQKYEYKNLCVRDSEERPWRVRFIGEEAEDAGGPYRESLDNIVDEVQSTCLPLLIPTQNNKNDHGPYRECWTINPFSTAPHHLEMYKFLGGLIGMAFRAGHVIDIRFPPLLWKILLGENVIVEDLATSDLYAAQAIIETQKTMKTLTPEEFDAEAVGYFTTPLSNGETVPLVKGGEDKPVTYANAEEYHALILKTRVQECEKQLQALKEGFEIVFPVSMLRILTWKDIEDRVRGPSDIDIELLKSITSYQDCSHTTEHVKRFWRVFEGFDNEQRSLFLKFTWGRCRLPPKNRLCDSRFQLTLIRSGRYSDHDIQLPVAHTCFFNLELPRYSTDDICRAKILYAITTCGDMDIY